jgi:hypothetical protein
MWLKTEAPRPYRSDLNKIINEIFKEAGRQGLTWQELANRASVSTNTVRKIRDFETVYPHYYTVWRLGKAVGMEMGMHFKSAPLKVRRA